MGEGLPRFFWNLASFAKGLGAWYNADGCMHLLWFACAKMRTIHPFIFFAR